MKSLILIAAGSPRDGANDEVRGLAAAVAARMDGRYDRVACGFLDHAEPDVGTVVDREVAAGVTEIVGLPCFLWAETSLVADLPPLVEAARERHPSVVIRLERYLGARSGLAGLVAEAVP